MNVLNITGEFLICDFVSGYMSCGCNIKWSSSPQVSLTTETVSDSILKYMEKSPCRCFVMHRPFGESENMFGAECLDRWRKESREALCSLFVIRETIFCA